MIDAVALNPHHLLAKKAPQPIGIARRMKTRPPLLLSARRAHLFEQIRMADQLIREILAVLEKVDRAACQLRRCPSSMSSHCGLATTFSRNDSKLSSVSENAIAAFRDQLRESRARADRESGADCGGKLGARGSGFFGIAGRLPRIRHERLRRWNAGNCEWITRS